MTEQTFIYGPVYWLSELDDCDFCNGEFDGVMYDVALLLPASAHHSSRHWGNACQTCFDQHDGQLGTGKGQKYELSDYGDKKAWKKVAG